jgi:hypothetical protein
MGPVMVPGLAPAIDISYAWLGLRWVYILVALMFVVFGMIVITQVKQMNAAFQRPFNRILTAIGWGYLGLTILVFIMMWRVL